MLLSAEEDYCKFLLVITPKSHREEGNQIPFLIKLLCGVYDPTQKIPNQAPRYLSLSNFRCFEADPRHQDTFYRYLKMHFMIVRTDPVYETHLPGEGATGDELAYLHQFILHSSLDMVKSAMENTSALYLKVVDRFNNSQVSAYVTPGGAVFLLLHHGRSEDVTRHFFVEIHDLYVKHCLNPLVQLDATIVSPRFDSLVHAAARRL